MPTDSVSTPLLSLENLDKRVRDIEASIRRHGNGSPYHESGIFRERVLSWSSPFAIVPLVGILSWATVAIVRIIVQ